MQFSMYEKVISQKEEGEINGSKMDSGTVVAVAVDIRLEITVRVAAVVLHRHIKEEERAARLLVLVGFHDLLIVRLIADHAAVPLGRIGELINRDEIIKIKETVCRAPLPVCRLVRMHRNCLITLVF